MTNQTLLKKWLNSICLLLSTFYHILNISKQLRLTQVWKLNSKVLKFLAFLCINDNSYGYGFPWFKTLEGFFCLEKWTHAFNTYFFLPTNWISWLLWKLSSVWLLPKSILFLKTFHVSLLPTYFLSHSFLLCL